MFKGDIGFYAGGHVMGPARVRVWDPCHLRLEERLTAYRCRGLKFRSHLPFRGEA